MPSITKNGNTKSNHSNDDNDDDVIESNNVHNNNNNNNDGRNGRRKHTTVGSAFSRFANLVHHDKRSLYPDLQQQQQESLAMTENTLETLPVTTKKSPRTSPPTKSKLQQQQQQQTMTVDVGSLPPTPLNNATSPITTHHESLGMQQNSPSNNNTLPFNSTTNSTKSHNDAFLAPVLTLKDAANNNSSPHSSPTLHRERLPLDKQSNIDNNLYNGDVSSFHPVIGQRSSTTKGGGGNDDGVRSIKVGSSSSQFLPYNSSNTSLDTAPNISIPMTSNNNSISTPVSAQFSNNTTTNNNSSKSQKNDLTQSVSFPPQQQGRPSPLYGRAPASSAVVKNSNGAINSSNGISYGTQNKPKSLIDDDDDSDDGDTDNKISHHNSSSMVSSVNRYESEQQQQQRLQHQRATTNHNLPNVSRNSNNINQDYASLTTTTTRRVPNIRFSDTVGVLYDNNNDNESDDTQQQHQQLYERLQPRQKYPQLSQSQNYQQTSNRLYPSLPQSTVAATTPPTSAFARMPSDDPSSDLSNSSPFNNVNHYFAATTTTNNKSQNKRFNHHDVSDSLIDSNDYIIHTLYSNDDVKLPASPRAAVTSAPPRTTTLPTTATAVSALHFPDHSNTNPLYQLQSMPSISSAISDLTVDMSSPLFDSKDKVNNSSDNKDGNNSLTSSVDHNNQHMSSAILGNSNITRRQASLGADVQPIHNNNNNNNNRYDALHHFNASASNNNNDASNSNLTYSTSELVPPNMTEEDMLQAAIQASQLEQEQKSLVLLSSSTLEQQQSNNNNVDIVNNDAIEKLDVDLVKENARQLRNICAADSIDSSLLAFAMEECQRDQDNLSKYIEQGECNAGDSSSSKDDNNDDVSNNGDNLSTLLDLNGIVLHALEMGRDAAKRAQNDNSEKLPPALSVQDYARQQDVFSLICMLRAQQTERRIEAALELMKFARNAEIDRTDESVRLRDEIRSSGGMHSLLALFQAPNTSYELRAVVALAIAYVLPAFVVSESQAKPSLGINIMKCLQFLSVCRAVNPMNFRINKEECFRAAATGLLTFWNNHCEPVFSAAQNDLLSRDKNGSSQDNNFVNGMAGGSTFDQPKEQIELQELLEMTVSLIMHVAKCFDKGIDLKGANPALLVEQACALEVARPIAVRDGVISLLVHWIKSKDREKIRLGVSSLQYLTSIQDKYMAGWIHSQIVNEEALPALMKLTQDAHLSQDSRLRIAQVLSTLCVAPHTRAAVVKADSLHFLVDILYEHTDEASQEVALFAGKAILQLAAGTLSRASIFTKDDAEMFEYISFDKRETVIEDIIGRGALLAFSEIAKGPRGALRSMAIESLRVFSEDVNSGRKTRAQLCEDGAATSLSIALKDDSLQAVDSRNKNEVTDINDSLFKEIHDAVCTLSNIFEQPNDVTSGSKTRNSSSQVITVSHVESCIQVAGNGGIEALLDLLMLPPSKELVELSPFDFFLLCEVCRALSLLSPLLLHDRVATNGYSHLSVNVLAGLRNVLECTNDIDDFNKINPQQLRMLELGFQGVASLAVSSALKVIIVDSMLPYVIQARNIPNQSKLANAATQAFQAIGFADDEVAVQLAGNNPSFLTDWFCLKRSLLIQEFAKAEVRRSLHSLWDSNIGPTEFVRIRSNESCHSVMINKGTEIFDALVAEDISAESRSKILHEYSNLYNAEDKIVALRTMHSDARSRNASLLKHQVYPLNSACNEAEWIFMHNQTIRSSYKMVKPPGLSEHTEKLLLNCFPSRLLRQHVIPLTDFRPDASFDFRALMMPQRRYYSFRREGQLLAHLCSNSDESLSVDVFWTLCFNNSTFDGEFIESLVQSLYICPVISGLSFSASHKGIEECVDTSKHGDGGTRILANLAGSLPPWISCLTFDGVMDERDLRDFVAIIEIMSKLSHGREKSRKLENKSKNITQELQEQGKYWFLGITRTYHVSDPVWKSFFMLLGRPGSLSNGVQQPLATLKLLDVSSNNLGDELCAFLLQTVYSQASECSLEQLDMSNNCIGEGSKVFEVLEEYAEAYMSPKQQQFHRMSTLHTLNLSSNELHKSDRWIKLFEWKCLHLRSLDLSGNNLHLNNTQCDMITSSLPSTFSLLRCLNLSKNSFSYEAIESVIYCLEVAKQPVSVLFLDLSQNTPPITEMHEQKIDNLLGQSRYHTVQSYINDVKLQGRVSINDNSRQSDNKKLTLSLHKESEILSLSESAHSPSIRSKHKPMHHNRSPHAEKLDNMITVLFSAPLVYQDAARVLRPFAKLDFNMERELLWQCLKEAGRDIQLTFDCATHDRLLATMAKRCSCLHYSGHGHQQYLPFENGRGGPHWLEVNKIRELIARREGGVPFRFVFVSACFSGLAGRTFAEAGVPHVVCCQQEFELKDAAALAFTRQFYLALAVGHTVKYSFEQGCKAVRATPNLRNANGEMKKFVLLPEDGEHDVPVFDAKPVSEWPQNNSKRHIRSTSMRNLRIAGTGTSDLSVRNMIQEDPSPSPPQFFIGREVDMYYILDLVLQYRLVSVVGEIGVGRSSIVRALCHYINERASTMQQIERIYFVKVRRSRKKNVVAELTNELYRKLVEAGKARSMPPNSDVEDYFEAICAALKTDATLIVFDKIEHLDDADETNAFPALLKSLLHETRNVKILLTTSKSLGIPSLNDHPYTLEPLNYANTVRLFSNLCTYLHTPLQRKRFIDQLIGNPEQAELLPTDPGLSKDVRRVFDLLGRGIPAQIEKAAYMLSKEAFMSLNKGEIPEQNDQVK